jgi:hypothetical protein
MTLGHMEAWLAQAFEHTSLSHSTITVPSTTSLCFTPPRSIGSAYRVRQIQTDYDYEAYQESIQALCHLLRRRSDFAQHQWPYIYSSIQKLAIPHLWLILDHQGRCICLFKLTLDEHNPDNAQLEIFHDFNHFTLLSFTIPMLVSLEYAFECLGVNHVQFQFEIQLDGLNELLSRLGFVRQTASSSPIYQISKQRYYQP